MSTVEDELPTVARLRKSPRLRDEVARALRSAVISGEMRPGKVYSAPFLGERFGVSTTPIREAMLDLVREGLVEAMPNRGFRVTEVSDDDLREVTELRLLIEPPAVERAVPHVPPADVRSLRALAARIVVHAERAELVDYLTADSDFHLGLLRYSGNDRLVDLVASLRSQTRLFGLAALAQQGGLAASAQEHLRMIDAVERGDAAEARRLVHEHIQHVRTDWSGPPASRDTAV